jgi:uncharacterized membrane-anchored protein
MSDLAALLPPNHPDRIALAAEVHTRPPVPVAAPSRATYVAVRVEDADRAAEWLHIVALCSHFGVPPPQGGGTQWAAALGPLRFKWERHGEFSSYTFFAGGLNATPFAQPVATLLQPGWLAGVPGLTVFAAHALLAAAGQDEAVASVAGAVPIGGPAGAPFAGPLAAHFGNHVVVGAGIGDGAGLAFTDFVIHGDGFARFLLLDREMTEFQAGRMLQRLFEIEAYRMMAMLALPVARGLWPRLLTIERTLAELTERLARATADSAEQDEDLLHELMALAAEVESALSASQARFGASRAYHALVITRIAELREQRIQGLQTIDEFMTRRLSPAMATCATVSQRLHDLSERVAQASSLLSTRVDIARQQQNQALLVATARRAKLQLRLQQTVEGLSVAAIVYYLAGLVGYGAKALKAAGLPLSTDLITGAAVPVLALGAWWVLRGVHRRIAADDQFSSAAH